MMKKSFLAACCLLAGLGTSGIAGATEAPRAEAPIVLAQSVSVQVNTRPRVQQRTVVRRTVVRHRGPMARRTVIVRHDRGLHRGWRHAPAYGARRTTIIKKRGPLGITRSRTVIQSN